MSSSANRSSCYFSTISHRFYIRCQINIFKKIYTLSKSFKLIKLLSDHFCKP